MHNSCQKLISPALLAEQEPVKSVFSILNASSVMVSSFCLSVSIMTSGWYCNLWAMSKFHINFNPPLKRWKCLEIHPGISYHLKRDTYTGVDVWLQTREHLFSKANRHCNEHAKKSRNHGNFSLPTIDVEALVGLIPINLHFAERSSLRITILLKYALNVLLSRNNSQGVTFHPSSIALSLDSK